MSLNTRTIRLTLLGVAAVALSAVTAATAFAGDQDFTVVNKTGIEIHAIYVTPHKADDWGDDLLDDDTLADGESIDITFSRKERAAHRDLRVEDEKGNAVTWENLNLLDISKVILHYKNGKAWADIE